jgi:2,3-bisphosphoglycerate-dependent phosphoglycerate mutase
VLYLVRHCQTTGQAPDAPLTAEGEAQAERLAAFLVGLVGPPIEQIVSSPFVRARQSAAPLAGRLGQPVEIDPRLAERALGDPRLPGLPGPPTLPDDWREAVRASFADPDLAYPSGETGRAAQTRAVAAIADLTAQGTRTIVVVTHGNLLAWLLKHYDPRVGFAEWARLTNPDVFRLTVAAGRAGVNRIWEGT